MREERDLNNMYVLIYCQLATQDKRPVPKTQSEARCEPATSNLQQGVGSGNGCPASPHSFAVPRTRFADVGLNPGRCAKEGYEIVISQTKVKSRY